MLLFQIKISYLRGYTAIITRQIIAVFKQSFIIYIFKFMLSFIWQFLNVLSVKSRLKFAKIKMLTFYTPFIIRVANQSLKIRRKIIINAFFPLAIV